MRMRAHTQARNLPSPEALSPNIEEGVVNRRPLQALFLLPWGGALPATGPGAISNKNLLTMLEGWYYLKFQGRRPLPSDARSAAARQQKEDGNIPSDVPLPLF